MLSAKLDTKTEEKEYLRTEEAMKYLGLKRTRFLYKTNFYGYRKTDNGY